MDCNYILENEIHEKYLLRRLSEEEQKAYLTHLQICDKCSRDLENERLLINGLRSAGHKRMKAEIRRQVAGARASASRVDWGIILKAAAVLLIAVLLPALYFTQSDYSVKSISSGSAGKTPPDKERIYEIEKPAPLLEEKNETKAAKKSVTAGSAKKRTTTAKLKTVAEKHASGLKAIPPRDEASALSPVLSGGGAGSAANTAPKDEALSSFSMQAQKPAFQQRTFRFKDKIFVTRFFSEGKRIGNRDIFSDSLHVEINTRDGRKFLLNCYLPVKLSRVNRDSVQVHFLSNQTLQIRFPDSTIYKIQLQKASVQVLAPANK